MLIQSEITTFLTCTQSILRQHGATQARNCIPVASKNTDFEANPSNEKSCSTGGQGKTITIQVFLIGIHFSARAKI